MTDPAFETNINPNDFATIADVPRDPDAVYLFDFDGVIVSGEEDRIYRLAERPIEKARFREIEDALRLRTSDLEIRYRRHLLFQELALKANLKMLPGPGFGLAKWASNHARFFILTARSAWAATARVRQFLEDQGMRPIDLYQVGRVHKERQILQTLEEFPKRTVYYIEDSASHLKKAATLSSPNLKLVHCASRIQDADVERLYGDVFGRDL